jgi:hypothetical protein
MNSKELILIVGPTQSGKTRFAINYARKMDSVLLPIDQLHFYKHLFYGVDYIPQRYRGITKFGYHSLSPWLEQSPIQYVKWLDKTLDRLDARDTVIEGGCTSYLNALLTNSKYARSMKIVALKVERSKEERFQRISTYVTYDRIRKIIKETARLESAGYIKQKGIDFLRECETLFKHPNHEDNSLAWAIRISSKIYCPAYLGLLGKLTLHKVRQRILKNILEIQQYQIEHIVDILGSVKVRSSLEVNKPENFSMF